MEITLKKFKFINGKEETAEIIEDFYSTESGSLKVGTLNLQNGYGDGTFKLYFTNLNPLKMSEIVDMQRVGVWGKDDIISEKYFVDGLFYIYRRETSFYIVVDNFQQIKLKNNQKNHLAAKKENLKLLEIILEEIYKFSHFLETYVSKDDKNSYKKLMAKGQTDDCEEQINYATLEEMILQNNIMKSEFNKTINQIKTCINQNYNLHSRYIKITRKRN